MADMQYTEIGGTKYVFAHLKLAKSMALNAAIVQLIGMPLYHLLAQTQKGKDDDLESAALHALQSLLTQLEYSKMRELMDPILGCIRAEGKGTVLECLDQMDGQLLTVYKLFIWGLKCEYRDFLDGSHYLQALTQIMALRDLSKDSHG